MIRRLLTAWRRTRTGLQPTIRVRLPDPHIPSTPVPEPPLPAMPPDAELHAPDERETKLRSWLNGRTAP